MAVWAKGSYRCEYPPLVGDAVRARGDTCEICEGEGTIGCSACSGSGEGIHDGTTCRTCGGDGTVPCECQAERLEDEAAAKDAALEAKAEERREARRETD